MRPLFMVEIQFDSLALHRYLHSQDLAKGNVNLSYGVHAWLAAAFTGLNPKPWRLLMDRRRPPRILAYSRFQASDFRTRILEFADPSVLNVCPKPNIMINSRVMPGWTPGKRLGFEVLCCPVGRKSGSGIEKDIFLIRADQGGEGLQRNQVYTEWAIRMFAKHSVAALNTRLAGFRLVKHERRNQKERATTRKRQIITRPEALVVGELTIGDSQQFATLLARGLGRHCSFGYGMILLKPLA